MFILKFVFILLEVLLLFNLLIFVHELGHFLAARWRGLKIDRFAVWFGKPIWKKEVNGIVYCLGCIPAGGYVALPQMASMETIEGKADTSQGQLPPISALDKIIVAFAGPLFSMGLALAFAVVVWLVGRPISETETTTTIGYVFKGSPAEAAGLKAGDRILKVDGKPVTRFGGIGDTVTWRIVRSEGETVPVTVLREGRELTFNPMPVREKTEAWERRSLREIQILPLQTPIIARVEENMPAALAKIRPNDIVLEVNGLPIYNPQTLVDEVRKSPDKPMTLKLLRHTNTLTVTMTPVIASLPPEAGTGGKPEQYPRLGLGWESGGKMDVDHPGPLTQIRASVSAMGNTLSAVLSRKSDIGFQHLSGPVGIVRIYYRLFESEQGWRLALWFSVVLNVNLALLNMLPIPVLDGGHITLALIEAIRRKPVSVRLLNIVQTSCAVVIIGYMVFVTFFDAQDLRFWKRGSKSVEPKAQPSATSTNK